MSNLKTSKSVGFSILVVDDAPFVVEALRTFLSSFSADVLKVANVKEGLKKAPRICNN